MNPFVLVSGVLTIAILAWRWAVKTDIPKIKGLPELPAVPIFGSLLLLGQHHARNCAKLRYKFGDVFQVRLGNRRIIYANSFDSVKELWIKNQTALASRPTFWTFHGVVSKTQGVYTIGTSPWSEGIKKARKVAATALNRQAVQQYLPFIDLESTVSIDELFRNALTKSDDIDPNGYFQRFSLNISLTLNYGIRIQGNVHDQTLQEVVAVERELGNIRGVAHCWQDYIPMMRIWPGYKKHAIRLRARRDQYILMFLEKLKEKMANGTDNPCIAGNVLKDPEAQLTENELKSVCLTMVAAGLDTLPGNINMTIAYLSSPHGQEIQQRAFDEIMKAHEGEDPWHDCLREEKSEYMRSFVKEVLRFWSTLNMSFTRQSIKDIEYQGATIPAGTPFFMNMWAANHDSEHFKSPMDFVPDRFMGVEEAGGGTQHFGYGAGSRMCTGNHLANRELYAMFVRLILAFNIRETRDLRKRPILDSIECNSVPTSFVTQPKPFQVRFVPRDVEKVQNWIEESFEQTAHL